MKEITLNILLDKIYSENADVMCIENQTFKGNFAFSDWVYTLDDIIIENRDITDNNVMPVANNGLLYTVAKFSKKLVIKNCNLENFFFYSEITDQSLLFENLVEFENITISGQTDFTGVEFKKGLNASIINFGEIKSEGSEFNKITTFKSCDFQGVANFQYCKFQSKKSTKGIFVDCKFMQNVYFNHAHFEGQIHFVGNKFFSTCTFLDITFSNLNKMQSHHLRFIMTEVNNDFEIVPMCNNAVNPMFQVTLTNFKTVNKGHIILDFRNVLYRGAGQIAESNHKITLSKISYVTDQEIIRINGRNNNNNNIDLIFSDCWFKGSNVLLYDVNIKNTHFSSEGSALEGIRYINCKWPKKDVPEMQVYLCFKKVFGFKLKKTTLPILPINENIENFFETSHQTYGRLEKMAKDTGQTQLANHFHFWQLYYQRLLNDGGFFNNFWNHAYFWVSAYGQSAFLPVFWYLLLLLNFMVFYSFFQHTATGLDTNFNHLETIGLSKGFWLSASAGIPFVGTQTLNVGDFKPLPTDVNACWFYLLYVFQQILQSFMIFQFGSAVRNKVKL